jgi:hypothetical protein
MEQIDNYRLYNRDQAESRESNPFWNSIESVPNSLRSSHIRFVLQSQLRKQRRQTRIVQSSAVALQWEKRALVAFVGARLENEMNSEIVLLNQQSSSRKVCFSGTIVLFGVFHLAWIPFHRSLLTSASIAGLPGPASPLLATECAALWHELAPV